jgi:uncharacterized protein YqjF (DUF2071 family)
MFMTQSWHDLLLAHWPADASQMRRAVPNAFDLDVFDGQAWPGVVPFYPTKRGYPGDAVSAVAVGIPET